MLRAMLTAIGALTLEQSKMDVISNNIANVNTQGFKASRTNFQDQFSQILDYGAAPTTTRGGLDPSMIGLGVRLGSVSREFSQGSLESTGRNLDLSVQGDGFFIFQDPNANSTQFFSRDGSLEMDSQGTLVNIATGYQVLGWSTFKKNADGSLILDVSGNPQIDTGQNINKIQLPLNSSKARATSKVMLSGNLDSKKAVGGTYDSVMSVYDSLGALHNVTITFTKGASTATGTGTGKITTWSWAATGTLPEVVTGGGEVTFDENGLYTGATVPIPPISVTGSTGAQNILLKTTTAFDLSKITQMAQTDNVSMAFQNGLAAAAVQNFIVDSNNGDIYAVYGNGLQDKFGRISLSTFTNPEGLTQLGKNMYALSLNSGASVVGWPGNGGKGTLAVGYTEGSNVDMGREFTQMILAQRGFQAASRMITTSDEMLQEIVNLKR